MPNPKQQSRKRIASINKKVTPIVTPNATPIVLKIRPAVTGLSIGSTGSVTLLSANELATVTKVKNATEIRKQIIFKAAALPETTRQRQRATKMRIARLRASSHPWGVLKAPQKFVFTLKLCLCYFSSVNTHHWNRDDYRYKHRPIRQGYHQRSNVPWIDQNRYFAETPPGYSILVIC